MEKFNSTWKNETNWQNGDPVLDQELCQKVTDNIDELIDVAITEKGKNSNGNWVKFANGIMICWGKVEKSKFKSTSSMYENCQSLKIYRSTSAEIRFPVAFKSSEDLVVTAQIDNDTQGTRTTWCRVTPTTTLAYIQLTGFEDFLVGSIGYENLKNVMWKAIGFWK